MVDCHEILTEHYQASSIKDLCPVNDLDFWHNIVKVAVDPQGDSRGDPQTTLRML